MQNRLRSSGITCTSAPVALTLAGCAGGASTIPTDSTPTNLDAERIEIIFGYFPGVGVAALLADARASLT